MRLFPKGVPLDIVNNDILEITSFVESSQTQNFLTKFNSITLAAMMEDTWLRDECLVLNTIQIEKGKWIFAKSLWQRNELSKSAPKKPEVCHGPKLCLISHVEGRTRWYLLFLSIMSIPSFKRHYFSLDDILFQEQILDFKPYPAIKDRLVLITLSINGDIDETASPILGKGGGG